MLIDSDVQNYISSLLPARTGILEKIESESKERHIPIVEPEVAQFLRFLITVKNPSRIVEIGTGTGYSTISMAKALKPSAMIETIELNPIRYQEAIENIKVAGYANQVRLHHGHVFDLLPHIEGEFEFVFMDAAKGQYLELFNMIFPRLKVGGIIVAEDIFYEKLVVLDREDIRKRNRTMSRRLRTYLDLVVNHPQLETTLVPLGDGLAVSCKKG